MSTEVLQATSTLAAVLAALAAVFSGVCAFLSFKLAKKIHEELASDERILTGTPIHPGLREPAHDQCVIRCTLFNKSKRKVHIESVEAYDRRGNALEVTWALIIGDRPRLNERSYHSILKFFLLDDSCLAVLTETD